MNNPFKKIAHNFAKTASSEAKKEVKKTALDLLPGALMIVGTVIGIVLFHNYGSDNDSDSRCPCRSSTSITTNNYFFQDVSDETILKIMNDDL